MIFPDVKGIASRIRKESELRAENIVNLDLMRSELFTRQAVLLEALKHMESEEWNWLVNRFLPAERMRLAIETADMNPLDPQAAEKRCIAHGQYAETVRIAEKLSDVKKELAEVNQNFVMVERQIENLKRRSK